jgi:acetylornithine deacetylase/succinyl-diaminopimelate desuccinylase-like protein
LRYRSCRPQSKTALDHPFAALVLAAVGQRHAQEPLAIPAMGGSLPDYVFTKLLGVPAFVTPYANADEANHAPNENLELERCYKRIRTGVALLANLGAHARS